VLELLLVLLLFLSVADSAENDQERQLLNFLFTLYTNVIKQIQEIPQSERYHQTSCPYACSMEKGRVGV
jgi:hypothetical protein